MYSTSLASRISGFILRERALLLSLALAYVRSIYRVPSTCIVLVLYIRNYIRMKWPHYLVTADTQAHFLSFLICHRF